MMETKRVMMKTATSALTSTTIHPAGPACVTALVGAIRRLTPTAMAIRPVASTASMCPWLIR
jgi:hypothetical protein